MVSTPRVISSPSCSNSRRNWFTSISVRSCSTWRKASCARVSIRKATAPTLAVMLIVTRRSNLVFSDKSARSFHPELIELPPAGHELLPVVGIIIQPDCLGQIGHRKHAMAGQQFAFVLQQVFRTGGGQNCRYVFCRESQIIAQSCQRDGWFDRLQRYPQQDRVGIDRRTRS